MKTKTMRDVGVILAPRLWLDRTAIMLGTICAVHCILTPFLILLLPIIGTTVWVHQDFHWWMLSFVIPTTALAVFGGCRRHRDRRVAVFAVVGLCFLVLALFQGQGAGVEGAASLCCPLDHGSDSLTLGSLHAESIMTTIGGAFLIAGHFRNLRLCRRGCLVALKSN